jgi:hypothetical protein
LHLTELDKLIATASTLPLLDAAYTLWLYSNDPWLTKDDAWDFQGGSSTETIDHSSPAAHVETLRKVIRQSIAAIRFRETNAHLGPPFYWLKSAHPDADDSVLQNAIRAAIKFDQDCVRFFAYNSKNYIEDVETAVNRASDESPGFTEPTLKRAHSRLCWAMR